MAGIKRIIIGLIIMLSGLYMWYETLNENIPAPDSEPIIDSGQILDSTFLMAIQGVIIAIGVVVLTSGSMAAKK